MAFERVLSPPRYRLCLAAASGGNLTLGSRDRERVEGLRWTAFDPKTTLRITAIALSPLRSQPDLAPAKESS